MFTKDEIVVIKAAAALNGNIAVNCSHASPAPKPRFVLCDRVGRGVPKSFCQVCIQRRENKAKIVDKATRLLAELRMQAQIPLYHKYLANSTTRLGCLSEMVRLRDPKFVLKMLIVSGFQLASQGPFAAALNADSETLGLAPLLEEVISGLERTVG